MFYDIIFSDSLIMYLIIRYNFSKNLIFKECGDFLGILDINLSDTPFIVEILKGK